MYLKMKDLQLKRKAKRIFQMLRNNCFMHFWAASSVISKVIGVIIMSMLSNFSLEFASNFTLADRLFCMLIGSGYLPLPFVS